MNGHQVRRAQLYNAVSEAILTSYGFIPCSDREWIVAHALERITLYQAYHEDWVREQVAKAGYSSADLADVVSELHAPISGAA